MVTVVLLTFATAASCALPIHPGVVAPLKFVPVIVITVPTGPLDGVNELMVGAAGAALNAANCISHQLEGVCVSPALYVPVEVTILSS